MPRLGSTTVDQAQPQTRYRIEGWRFTLVAPASDGMPPGAGSVDDHRQAVMMAVVRRSRRDMVTDETGGDVTIEAEGRTFKAKGSVADAAERDRLWDQHVAALPHFAAYPEQTGRVIPMVRLTPVA